MVVKPGRGASDCCQRAKDASALTRVRRGRRTDGACRRGERVVVRRQPELGLPRAGGGLVVGAELRAGRAGVGRPEGVVHEEPGDVVAVRVVLHAGVQDPPFPLQLGGESDRMRRIVHGLGDLDRVLQAEADTRRTVAFAPPMAITGMQREIGRGLERDVQPGVPSGDAQRHVAPAAEDVVRDRGQERVVERLRPVRLQGQGRLERAPERLGHGQHTGRPLAEHRPAVPQLVRQVVEAAPEGEAAALDAGSIPLIVLAGIAAREVVVEAGRAAGEAERREGHALGDVAVFEELRRTLIAGHADEAKRDLADGRGRGRREGSILGDGHGRGTGTRRDEHENEHVATHVSAPGRRPTGGWTRGRRGGNARRPAPARAARHPRRRSWKSRTACSDAGR